MNRLPLALHRLYVPNPAGGPDTDPDDASLIDADGRVRAMVLELARPADWEALSKVWHGVQVDLALPAPAIAVSGKDGYQLWFSLAAPLPAAQAAAFLESLRRHYLGNIKPQRVTMMPTLQASPTQPLLHARLVPSLQAGTGLWSAFVAPDLAPVFAEEPWLDLPPNLDGQASLLARLDSIQAADFQQALDRLKPAAPLANPQAASSPAERAGAVEASESARQAPAGGWRDPQSFLLDVINNDSLAMALRIDAAIALLPHFHPPQHKPIQQDADKTAAASQA